MSCMCETNRHYSRGGGGGGGSQLSSIRLDQAAIRADPAAADLAELVELAQSHILAEYLAP